MKEQFDPHYIFNDESDHNDPIYDSDSYDINYNLSKSKGKKSKGHTDQADDPPKRNLEGEGKPKWYYMIDYTPEFIEALPKLRYVRGAKERFTMVTFGETSDACKSIFECNKSFFRFRSQVDLMAHYIGTKILEVIFKEHKGFPKNKFSELLEKHEKENFVWDQMKIIKEVYASLMEKYIEGFVTEDEINTRISEYIVTLSESQDREKVKKIIEMMKMSGEEARAKDRLRKNAENRKKAEAKGIRVV